MKKHLIKINLTLFVLAIILLSLTACSDKQPSARLAVTDYPEHDSDAAKLYLVKCSECHAAPLPEIRSAKQWMAVVQRMQFRMTSKAIPALNKQEMATIMRYLETHARK